MAIYNESEQEEFNREFHQRLKDIDEKNEQRFNHTLERNNRTTQMDGDEYIEKWKRDVAEIIRLRKLGKRNTRYSPEFGFEIY